MPLLAWPHESRAGRNFLGEDPPMKCTVCTPSMYIQVLYGVPSMVLYRAAVRRYLLQSTCCQGKGVDRRLTILRNGVSERSWGHPDKVRYCTVLYGVQYKISLHTHVIVPGDGSAAPAHRLTRPASPLRFRLRHRTVR